MVGTDPVRWLLVLRYALDFLFSLGGLVSIGFAAATFFGLVFNTIERKQSRVNLSVALTVLGLFLFAMGRLFLRI